MTTILEVAVGVALAPVVFLLGLTLLQCAGHAIRELPYLWEDHPNVVIVLSCATLALVLSVTR